MLDSSKLSYAFGVPPANVKVYKNSFLYNSDDTITDICGTDYFATNPYGMRNGDAVAVTSSSPSDGGTNVCFVVDRNKDGMILRPLAPAAS